MSDDNSNDVDVLTDEMKVELGETLGISGQAKLQKLFALATSKIQQHDTVITDQNAKIARLTDQIELLTKLVDSHQHAIEGMTMKGGIVQ
jgi:glutamate mutase epsilon subunit